MICPQTRPWTLIPEECPPPVFLNLDTTFVRTIGRRYTRVNRHRTIMHMCFWAWLLGMLLGIRSLLPKFSEIASYTS